MNRLVVFTLVLVLTLSVPAGSLLAKGPSQNQAQNQTQKQLQGEDCVCDGPNCDGDCPQNSYQNQSRTANQGELPGGLQYSFQFMMKFFFGGSE